MPFHFFYTSQQPSRVIRSSKYSFSIKHILKCSDSYKIGMFTNQNTPFLSCTTWWEGPYRVQASWPSDQVWGFLEQGTLTELKAQQAHIHLRLWVVWLLKVICLGEAKWASLWISCQLFPLRYNKLHCPKVHIPWILFHVSFHFDLINTAATNNLSSSAGKKLKRKLWISVIFKNLL